MYYVRDIKQYNENAIKTKTKIAKILNSSLHVLSNLFVFIPLQLWMISIPYSSYRIFRNIQSIKSVDAKQVVIAELLMKQKLFKMYSIFNVFNLNIISSLLMKHLTSEMNLLKSRGIYLPERIHEIASIPNRLVSDFEYLRLFDAIEKYKQDSEKVIYLNTYKLSEISETVLKCLTNKKLFKKQYVTQTDMYVSNYDLCKTILCLGAMGTGKSVFIKNLFAQKHYSRALVFDVKCEYLEQFYRQDKDILFNIYDARSLLWDMISDVRENTALAQVIAEAITEQLSEQQRDFWITAATKLLKDAILFAATNNEGYSGIIDYINEYKENAVKTDNKTELSIYITLQQVIDTLEFCAKLEQHYLDTEQFDKFFRISDFVNSYDRNLYVTASLLHAKAQIPLLNALVSATLATLLSKPDSDDYTFVLLDEFLSIKLPEQLETQLFTTARSKALQLLLGTQYIPADPKREKTKQLLLNSRYITVIFKTVEPRTLELIENNFGDQEHVSIQSQYSTSTSETYRQSDNKIMNALQLKTTLRSASMSEQTQRQMTKIITKSMIAFLKEYHCLTIINNDIYLAKVDKFFYDMKHKPNPAFIPLNENINENIEEVNNND